jgi:hypothetical protein
LCIVISSPPLRCTLAVVNAVPWLFNDGCRHAAPHDSHSCNMLARQQMLSYKRCGLQALR